MTPQERKAAFRNQADLDGLTLGAASYRVCGVSWIHLSEALKNNRPVSEDVKTKFAAYIGRDVADVFGDHSGDAAA